MHGENRVARTDIRLDHCVIASSDLDRTDAFYRDVLGAEIAAPMENFRQYRIGGQMLNVHGPGLQARAPADLLARLPVMPGGSDLCFVFPGTVDQARAWLAERGVLVHFGPADREGANGSGRSVYFRDPDGSLLEFICYE